MDIELENLRGRVLAFCKERGYALSPDADKILRDIIRMKETTGEYYCPCRQQRGPDTICICKPVRNGLVDIMGTCFCNLIVAPKS